MRKNYCALVAGALIMLVASVIATIQAVAQTAQFDPIWSDRVMATTAISMSADGSIVVGQGSLAGFVWTVGGPAIDPAPTCPARETAS